MESVPSREEIQLWLERSQPYKCYLTGQLLDKKDIELDHKIPTSRGGIFSLINVGITYKRVNLAKGSMTEIEYRSLLKCITRWEDRGNSLLARLRCSNNVYRRI